MSVVFVKASKRARAYIRKSVPVARLTEAILKFTPANRFHQPSAIRALKRANNFIAKGSGSFGQRRGIVAAAKVDRGLVQKALTIKKARGFRKSTYK